MTTLTREQFQPNYSAWRHGGWYVHNVRYVSGAIGCVSRNYADRKWRIVGHPDHSLTFRTRDDAAYAEYLYARTPAVVEADIAGLEKDIEVYLERGTPEDHPVLVQRRSHIQRGQSLLAEVQS